LPASRPLSVKADIAGLMGHVRFTPIARPLDPAISMN
jgi:hypothetical protein